MNGLLAVICLRPLSHTFRKYLGLNGPDLTDLACESWQISPPETRQVEPVIILPGQAERIVRTEFASLDMVLRSLIGDHAEPVGPTMGYRLRDVSLVDGILYAKNAAMHLRQRKHPPRPARLNSIEKASLFETWVGNRWFGNWLLDDCLSYRLAEETGNPVTTMPERAGHVPDYEARLNMQPRRIGDCHFEELILFDDHANNSHHIARAQDMRRRLLAGVTPAPNDGVFLLRGRSGDARLLENEDEIAKGLEQHFGFRVLFAEDHSVESLMRLCGQTKVVAGVEGSQLNHGIAVMPPGGTLFTLQPPDRATTAMKLLSDRWQQRFAMVVGHGRAESFRIDWEDVARTMELILAAREAGDAV